MPTSVAAKPQGTSATGWAAVAASLPPGVPLTVGVIARNGMPFLGPCLAALPPEGALGAGRLEVILVDSASADGTTAAMTGFAALRSDARAFRIDGVANASATRNVVLANARPGFVMMLDGDMVLNAAFLTDAIRRIVRGEAHAVVGALREQRFTADNRPDGPEIWRHPPVGPRPVRVTGGAILLGPAALASGLTYDERQRMCEDWDFALRLTRRLRILRIPEVMALHLTHYYFASHRLGAYYRDLRPRNLGRLLRKHLARPGRLAAVVERERGVAAGGVLQGAMLGALAAGAPLLAGGAALLLAADAARAACRGKAAEWAGTRLAAPWMVAYGLLTPGGAPLAYGVRRIA